MTTEPTPYFDSTITTAKHDDGSCTDIDADRAAALLAAGVRLAGRTWRQVLGEPAPQTGGDTLVLEQPVVERPHEVTAEWDAHAGVWLHECAVCGERSQGDAPTLPCPGPPDGGETRG